MALSKVSVRRLPDVAPPIPEGGGRMTSDAGELAQIANGEPFRFLAYLQFKPDKGAPRGNHFHRVKNETLYVIGGRLRARFRDIDTGESMDLLLEPGDLVTVAPRCAHAYLPLEYSQAVELSPSVYDPTDTLRFDLGITTPGRDEVR
ncbi:hypothetical protein GCM10023322_23050 [Rugosimonospora acidiphila]|uniref:Capsular polysaccharide assembling protein CapF C-terminal domain-containing protein n=1 Tax=Rugosimonospora acidiphila TaxID=556531 RepID=A0ABP9RPJ3_9ACTN